MKKFKISHKSVGLVRPTLEPVKCKGKKQNNLSEPSGKSMGLRQGDPRSCILFNVVLEKVVRNSGLETKRTMYNKTTEILAYADYIVLVGKCLWLNMKVKAGLRKVTKKNLWSNYEKCYMEIKV
jgi:sorting nexin-29